MPPKTERRFTDGSEVRLEQREDGVQTITGYAAMYYRKSNTGTQFQLWDGSKPAYERIMPGAFDAAIERSDDVRGLFNHDSNLILGRTAAGTLRLTTDSRGLKYEIDVPDTQTGRDLIVSIERGDVSGSSFAFKVEKETWRDDAKMEVREVEQVQLFDVSPVTYPAYQATTSGIRGVEYAKECRDLWREHIDTEAKDKREANQRQWNLIDARVRLRKLLLK